MGGKETINSRNECSLNSNLVWTIDKKEDRTRGAGICEMLAIADFTTEFGKTLS